ncbi:HprK-related kinase B [Zhongshania borealis]|uniref:HprK-related kinase B n=1 Tax=Zhongshania borealis TaxID=889488 RepID=A0ABP7WN25_9GAMM
MPNSEILQDLADTLCGGHSVNARHLDLKMGDFCLRVRSNSDTLLEILADYFGHIVSAFEHAPLELIAIDRDEPTVDLRFVDWRREGNKQGRKDSYINLDNARLLRKVRTGMVFLQSTDLLLAAGPCVRNDNQVINFIIAQYMNWLQQRNWLICHAAGIVCDGQAFGLAGFSGGGKSTLMLQMMENPAIQFVSNDRLFIKKMPGVTSLASYAAGVPKLPRINPGTIVHNPRLENMIPAPRRTALLAMPKNTLWDLEEKYDADIESLYGAGRISNAPVRLAGFVVLNWQGDSVEQTQLNSVNLNQRRDLLAAIVKSSGPFYQRADGSFQDDLQSINEQQYLETLAGVPVYEVCGRRDFSAARYLLSAKLNMPMATEECHV